MKRIAIWGTGITGQTWYWAVRNIAFVECFFTNTEGTIGSTIFNVPVRRWTPSDDVFIVIASNSWRDIALQLQCAGKVPIRDFMPWFSYTANMRNMTYQGIYKMRTLDSDVEATQYGEIKDCLLENKKIAVIYGNCQTGYYEKLFAMCSPFYSDYIIVEIRKVYEYEENTYWDILLHDRSFWESVGLFIYQTVDKTNRFSPLVASDNIIKLLRKDCKQINIVNIFFDGYFPQETKRTAQLLHQAQAGGLFWFGDKYITALLEQGKTLTEILACIKKTDFISPIEIEEKAEASLKELERREKFTDVKIADYLRDNYTTRQLFYSTNHPCPEVLAEYAKRIFRFMGEKYVQNFPDEDDQEAIFLQCGTLRGQDIPLYPSVPHVLGLKQYKRLYYPNRYIPTHSDTLLDFEEYMTLYIQACILSSQ